MALYAFIVDGQAVALNDDASYHATDSSVRGLWQLVPDETVVGDQAAGAPGALRAGTFRAAWTDAEWSTLLSRAAAVSEATDAPSATLVEPQLAALVGAFNTAVQLHQPLFMGAVVGEGLAYAQTGQAPILSAKRAQKIASGAPAS